MPLSAFHAAPGVWCPVWSSQFKKDIDRLKKDKKRAAKMTKSLERLTYEERLKDLGLFSLQNRRLRETRSQYSST